MQVNIIRQHHKTSENYTIINFILNQKCVLIRLSDNDAHGNSAFHPDGTSGGIVHTGEGGFELQTSLLSDKGIQLLLIFSIASKP